MPSVEHQPPFPAAGPQSARGAAEKRMPEPFIPISKAELIELLVADKVAGDAAASFRRLARLIDATIHREYHELLEELKFAYGHFDPDPDTRFCGDPLSPDELARRERMLFERFNRLLARANFRPLRQAEIDRALEDRTSWGLNVAVNFDVFDRVELFYRGDTVGTRYRRRLANYFRLESVEVPIYQRLAVIFHLRREKRLSKYLDNEDVHIKLFKDIPQLDLEMLLPGSNVRMSLFDRARIMLPTLSGISVAIWKILAVATFPLYTSLAFLGLVGGTVGYGVRSLFGYLNTKQKYQLNLTESLYYQNLDNNAGVIHRLIDEAEEQENREVLLAYFFLWRKAPPEGWSAARLDAEIETFLHAHACRPVDFEIHDALAKLARFALAEALPNDVWKAAGVDGALAALERRWAVLPQ
jgi:hypothetical protein